MGASKALKGWVQSLRDINVDEGGQGTDAAKQAITSVYDSAAGWSMKGELWNWGMHEPELAKEIESLLPGFERFDTDTFSEQLYLLTLREIPTPLTDYADKKVLEVGCGMGEGLNFLSRIVGPARLVGLDLAQTAVDRANSTLARGEQLRYVHGDAEALPFEDGEMDVVINVESSHNYPDLGRFLAEVTRVLKPGGYFSHIDIFTDQRLAEMRRRKEQATGLEWLTESDISEQVRASIRKRMLAGSYVRGLYENKRRHLPFAIRRMGGPGGIRFYGAEFAGYRDPAPVRIGNRLLGRPPKPALPEGSYRFSLARRKS